MVHGANQKTHLGISNVFTSLEKQIPKQPKPTLCTYYHDSKLHHSIKPCLYSAITRFASQLTHEQGWPLSHFPLFVSPVFQEIVIIAEVEFPSA